MNKGLACLFLLLVSYCSVAASDEQIELNALLQKMLVADQTMNYEGTLVYLQGTHVETMKVIHGVDETGVHARITSLSGDTREVYLNDKHLFAIMPSSGRVVVESRRQGLRQQSDEAAYLANPNYEYSLLGTERIAGRNCRVVSIYPRDNFRFGYRLCIEEKTGLLLKALTQDHAGKTYEQMMYTSISQPETITASETIPVIKTDDYELQTSVEKKLHQSDLTDAYAWHVQNLPPGFDVVAHSKLNIHGAPGPVEHFVLSDDIAALSVFISQIQTDSELEEGAGQSGCMNMYSRVTDGYHVTVIGAVPEKTIQFVAKSLYRQQ